MLGAPKDFCRTELHRAQLLLSARHQTFTFVTPCLFCERQTITVPSPRHVLKIKCNDAHCQCDTLSGPQHMLNNRRWWPWLLELVLASNEVMSLLRELLRLASPDSPFHRGGSRSPERERAYPLPQRVKAREVTEIPSTSWLSVGFHCRVLQRHKGFKQKPLTAVPRLGRQRIKGAGSESKPNTIPYFSLISLYGFKLCMFWYTYTQ